MVVVFEGSTELGDMFMVRQSYLAPQIHWGHSFCTIISHAAEGTMRHKVDLSRWDLGLQITGKVLVILKYAPV